MTAAEIKEAFEKRLPVIVCNPNSEPVECTHIKEVIYWLDDKGKKRVSCVMPDSRCPRCVIRARGRYIKKRY